eukprot:TRINITY_DN370_c0_g2_i1.p1 TRINITY_DN370_c0_g2~~TRINITY_DN370_c0_g2_i1.p1  ORF type:complete len:688 (+),score=251.63 TRINITY_DN370_c0_g2_i1:63-2126(+)
MLRRLVFAFLFTRVAGDAVNPIQKVVSMLGDLKGKIVADGALEDEAYNKYSKFCVTTKRDTAYEIQTGERDVEELQATIAKASADVGSNANRAGELQDAITKAEGDLQSATDMSKKEQGDFQASIVELKSAIDMLGRATKTLKDKLKGSALLQQPVQKKEEDLLKALRAVMDAAALPKTDKDSLISFVQSATQQAPGAPAYSSQSGSIIEVLEEMKEKARGELSDVGDQSSKSLHSFKMVQQSLQGQIAADQKEMKEVTSMKAEAQEEQATAESSLQIASKDLAADKATLKEYEASCQQADEGYAASKKSRAEEVAALTKATEVIQEKTGNAEGQTYKANSFVQVSQTRKLQAPAGSEFEIADKVRKLAKSHNSADLNKLANNIESLVQTGEPQEDVFKEVKELISKMISDKKAQAQKDSTKKAYCETEKAKTKEKLDDLATSNDKLGAKIDKKVSEAATMKSEAETLASELIALVKQQSEMDATRKAEKEVFAKYHKDLSDGLEGIRMALSVLRDYYQGTSQSPVSLLQLDPPSFGHSKDEGASTGIIGMLEVVESDFGRNLVEAETAEDSAQTEYVKLTDENKVSKVQKEANQKFKAQTSAAITQALQEKITDKEALAEELAAVQKYSKSLDEQCLEGGLTYEERVAAREAEIAGLKEALKTIGGTDLTLLQKSGGLRGMAVNKH